MIPTLPQMPGIGNISLPAAAPPPVVQSTYDIYMGMLSQFMMFEIVAIIMLVVVILVVLLFYPYLPWLKRVFNHKKLIGIMDTTGNITFDDNISLKGNIYFIGDRALNFVKRFPTEYQLSGVPFDILNLDLKFINHPKYIQWEKEMVVLGYINWQKIDIALLLNRLPTTPETEILIKKLGFESISDAKKTLNPANLTEKSQELAPYWQTLPVEDIEGYGYKFPTKSLNAEADDRRELLGTTHTKKLISTLIMGIIILIVMIGGALAYVMVSK